MTMMRNKGRIIAVVLGIAVIAAVAVKLRSNRSTVESLVYENDADRAVSVEVVQARMQDTELETPFTGIFRANREVKVSADIQAKVERVDVTEGQSVTKGQPLVILDGSLLALKLKAANAQVQALETDVKRLTALTKADAVPAVQLEKAETGLQTAQAERDVLAEQLSRTTVRAPFSGVVTARFTDAGAFAAPGVPLVEVTDISTLRFTVRVNETDLSLFSKGITHPVTSDAMPDLPLKSSVSSIGSKADQAGLFLVELEVSNPDGHPVRAGMFGRMSMKRPSGRAIVLPTTAIQGTDARPTVVLVRNGRARFTEVAVGGRTGNGQVISSGIAEGDTVITTGFIDITENVPVKAR